MRKQLSRVMESLNRIATSGCDHITVRQEVNAVLRRHLGFDVASWITVDPVTLAWTSCVVDGYEISYEAEASFFRNEYIQGDFLKLKELIIRGPADTLHLATGGEMEQSARYREVLSSLRLRDEMRVALMDGESCWGCALFYREGGLFSAEELEFVSLLSQPLAIALKNALLRSKAPLADARALPMGIAFTDQNGQVSALSPEVKQFLDRRLPGGHPTAITAVAVQALAGLPAQAILPGVGGGWIVFRGTRIGEQVAVLMEQAQPQQMSEMLTRAHGLTSREREIVHHVALGFSTREIAKMLSISEWTVQDHLKATFAKVGVQSRQALIASLFFGRWSPPPGEDAPPAS